LPTQPLPSLTARPNSNTKCAGCHGAHGNIQIKKARVLQMDARKHALKASKKNKAEIFEIVENGKGAMPGFKNDLSKEEIAAIIYYVMALSKK
jgi:mono/diheme cytochrome c family protein